MRVISGKARGTKLSSIECNTTRPTLDRVKESMFNILQEYISESTVLDLFAGSGALGIESLSRNSKYVVFCDNNKQATNIIKANLEKTKLLEKAEIINLDYKNCIDKLSNKSQKFDIVFIDPPYKDDIAVNSVKLILKNDLLSNKGIIVIETDEIKRDLKELNDAVTEGLEGIAILDQRKYGRANLLFLKNGK